MHEGSDTAPHACMHAKKRRHAHQVGALAGQRSHSAAVGQQQVQGRLRRQLGQSTRRLQGRDAQSGSPASSGVMQARLARGSGRLRAAWKQAII